MSEYLNIVIPAAGLGKRFNTNKPKPLLDVNGKPMLARVLENFNQHSNVSFTVCILKDHESKYNIIDTIYEYIKEQDIDVTYFIVDELQAGPAKTCYLTKQVLDKEEPLIIVNCDQIIFDLDLSKFISYANKNNVDGVIGTFYSNSPKNSYIKLDDDGNITQVKEKVVLSNYATNGLHYWSKSKYFYDSCDEMFANNDTVNNEFYVAPSYNYMIDDGMKIIQYFFNEHYPIGIPEDLEKFIKLYANI